MQKYSFLDDYSEGAHPNILRALQDTNLRQQIAYGNDEFSEAARDLLREKIGRDNLAIHFVTSGTQANIVAISSCLRPHEAVIAAGTGHIVLFETGAIEATGHKIIIAPSRDGKLSPEDIQTALDSNALFPHMAKPRLVYISNASEAGTIYKKAELRALSKFCRENGLLLFLDGARLGVALSALNSDMTLHDIASLTDVFWIGGTKAGALCGEAVVVCNENLAEDFDFHVKQRGALLSKGRVLGIQFLELFKRGLFFELTKHANHMASKISKGVREAGFRLSSETETNEIFVEVPNSLIEKLKSNFEFLIWEKLDNESSIIRLVTSWATEEDRVDELVRQFRSSVG